MLDVSALANCTKIEILVFLAIQAQPRIGVAQLSAVVGASPDRVKWATKKLKQRGLLGLSHRGGGDVNRYKIETPIEPILEASGILASFGALYRRWSRDPFTKWHTNPSWFARWMSLRGLRRQEDLERVGVVLGEVSEWMEKQRALCTVFDSVPIWVGSDWAAHLPRWIDGGSISSLGRGCKQIRVRRSGA